MKAHGFLAAGILLLASIPAFAAEGNEQPEPEKIPAPTSEVAATSAADSCTGSPCRHGESHLGHLLGWLTYRSTHQPCCGCLPKCVPCCSAPLYTYFPCQGFGICGGETCTSCGESAGPCKTDCYRFFMHDKKCK